MKPLDDKGKINIKMTVRVPYKANIKFGDENKLFYRVEFDNNFEKFSGEFAKLCKKYGYEVNIERGNESDTDN